MFKARVRGQEIEAVDLMRLDGDGKVESMTRRGEVLVKRMSGH